MLVVTAPLRRCEERGYILSVVLEDMLGLEFRVEYSDTCDWSIVLEGEQGEVVLQDILLGVPENEWLRPASLPREPLHIVEFGGRKIPAVYSTPAAVGTALDVFGSIFFLLTRYEERVLGAKDEHGRFPADRSLLGRERLLSRALVDEYVDCLWAEMTKRWPRLERRKHRYQISLTHDVDWITSVAQPVVRIARLVAGDLVRRRDVALALRRSRAAVWTIARRADVRDPADTFDFIMDTSEAHGLESAFYFLSGADRRPGVHNETYSLEDPRVGKLMASIHRRGHEIGLHGSYEAYVDAEMLAHEFDVLRGAAAAVGIEQDAWGGRQHFLRFEAPRTWAAWSKAGLAFDSSVMYAEAPGFRCGTTRDFRVFDLDARRALQLVERPLTAMEGSFIGSQYEGLSLEAATEEILALADVCRKHSGRFTMLWHNTALVRGVERDAYRELVAAVTTSR